NLLPLPALDGGHLMMHAMEASYGKPLPMAVQLAVQRIGVFIVIALFVMVFYNDFFRLFYFK
ncbi:MAG: site-2 protease family protein, partial [Silvanigrellaceae bacterium]|nr:site-2 protease family protein [Silvanigrellaceae bacterium]